MKTAFIILVVLLLATSVAACGATPAVDVDTGGLTADEQTSLAFIVEHTPELEDIYSQQEAAVQAIVDGDFDTAVVYINTYVEQWNTIKVGWEAFPAAGGKVAGIEMLFEDTANDLHDIHSGLGDAIEYGDVSGATAAVVKYNTDIVLLQDALAEFSGTPQNESLEL
jgi:hypothetical protein